MQEYLKMMKKRAEELKAAIETAGKIKFPEGRLRISHNGRYIHYYHVLPGEDKSGKYITDKKSEIVKKLAQKNYTKKFLSTAEKELSRLEHSISLLVNTDADRPYQLLPDKRKELVEPYLMTDELYAAQWEKEEFKASTFMPEGKIFETRKGEKVRSKSEAIIADMLFELGIPYRYEQLLMLKDKKVRYPDFTLLKVKSREVIYLEHFGLLDDEEYRNGCMNKLREYMSSGIYPGKNLMVTFESSDNPLDIGAIRKMFRELFTAGKM
ncbi:MAG: hypothetical protein K6B44_04885 [Lachnospiraceae bacterium]|nr:hypothetical protein [Lachnospiraceae bacterium]